MVIQIVFSFAVKYVLWNAGYKRDMYIWSAYLVSNSFDCWSLFWFMI